MFCDIFNKLLCEKGVTALTLSKEIGVPKSIVYEWKTGERLPSAENLKKLCSYFGVSASVLLEQNTPEEEEILLLLRRTRALSGQERDALLADLRAGLDRYLEGK